MGRYREIGRKFLSSSSETNPFTPDSPTKPLVSSSSQFDSMNPKLPKILIVIGFVWALLIVAWLLPRAISLYYQTRGGQLVERVLARGESTQWDGIACATAPAITDRTRERLGLAIQDLEKATQYNSQASHPQLLLGRAYCLIGEPEKAIDAYSIYVELRPNNPLGQLELGFAFEAACRKEERRESRARNERPEQQLCDNPLLTESMISAWSSAGLNRQDFINTGEDARRDGRSDDALHWYRRALQFSPDWADPWFYIGQVYYDQQEDEIAKEAHLIAFERGYTGSFDPLIEIFNRNNAQQELVAFIRNSLEKNPDNPDRLKWWKILGETIQNLGDIDISVQVFEEAIQEFPDDASLHSKLALSYHERGDGIDKVEAEFERAIALDPENGSNYYALARILVSEKRYPEADGWFEKAIERNPSAYSWRVARANAARDAGNFELAKQEYLATIELAENYAPAYYELAWLYRLEEKPEQATEAIEQALMFLKSPNLEYYLRAGAIYEWTEDFEKALESYRQALSINPQNQRASDKIEKLTGGDT